MTQAPIAPMNWWDMTNSEFLTAPLAWLGDNAISLLTAAAILVLGWYLARLASRAIRELLPRAYGVDKNFAPLLSQVARYGIIIFALVTALNLLGVSNASILAVLGAAGLAIALALQGTLANIAAGIMLIWLRPIAIGEFIQGDGVAGVVVEIGLFGTRLRSSSGLYIFTPNQKLWASAIPTTAANRAAASTSMSASPTASTSASRAISCCASPETTSACWPIRRPMCMSRVFRGPQ